MSAPPRAVVILDFGGQYTQLIARRVRDARVFSIVLPPGAPAEEIRRWNPATGRALGAIGLQSFQGRRLPGFLE